MLLPVLWNKSVPSPIFLDYTTAQEDGFLKWKRVKVEVGQAL